RLDGRVVATDLDRALQMLTEAEQLRSHAAVLLGGLDGAGLSRWLGYVSLERLVAHRTGCGNREARRLTKVAQHLDRFEATAAALIAGRIGWAHAEILAKAASGFSDAYAHDEAELVAAAEANEVERLEQICRLWRARADAEAAARDAEHRFNRRGVWLQFAFDGSCHGRLALDADGAEIVASALETKPDPVTPYGEARSAAQRRADALVEICQGGGDDARLTTKAAIDVVIDIETLAGANGSVERMRAELDHGGPITGPGLERLLCDASFRALITDGPRTVLAYNRATPAIPPGLRRAIRVRDRQCTFHGCDRPSHWCDLHHIVPRNRGGPTTAENLTLLCRFHHTLTHGGGWQLSRAPDGHIAVTRP
ncbi:MAG: DUF222 domain-containing protein, partial [Acidimicrobiales bacterium]